jgi:cytoskeletal protein CcmA (bactofilin family)
MFGTKETKSKSNNQIDAVTPLSGLNARLPNPGEKSPIGVSRVNTPSPLRNRIDPKDEAATETKKLTVGRGIALSGKIAFCDRVIVEGNVEAELQDCRTVEVTESGTFKGIAEIDVAEISGQYEGSLTVRETLLVHSTGRVSGTVRYGRLHIEDGGEINGDVKGVPIATTRIRSGTRN